MQPCSANQPLWPPLLGKNFKIRETEIWEDFYVCMNIWFDIYLAIKMKLLTRSIMNVSITE